MYGVKNLEHQIWLSAVIIGAHRARCTYDLVVIDAHKHQVVQIALQVEHDNIREQNLNLNGNLCFFHLINFLNPTCLNMHPALINRVCQY